MFKTKLTKEEFKRFTKDSNEVQDQLLIDQSSVESRVDRLEGIVKDLQSEINRLQPTRRPANNYTAIQNLAVGSRLMMNIRNKKVENIRSWVSVHSLRCGKKFKTTTVNPNVLKIERIK